MIVTNLFSNSINRSKGCDTNGKGLDPGIDDAEVGDAVHLQLRVHNAFMKQVVIQNPR